MDMAAGGARWRPDAASLTTRLRSGEGEDGCVGRRHDRTPRCFSELIQEARSVDSGEADTPEAARNAGD
jgi:hypothetical protein